MSGRATMFRRCGILVFLACLLAPGLSRAAGFDVMVVPSLMDPGLDGWYRVPVNSSPSIPAARRVTHGQTFSVIVLFRGYAVDKGKKADLRYDLQIYDPQGKPTEDKGKDLVAYEGEFAGNRDALLMSRQFMKVLFSESYAPGAYRITITAHDRIANKTLVKEALVELVRFSTGDKFPSEKEFDEWVQGYYMNPTPDRAIPGILQFVQLEPEWMDRKIGMLAFFRRIFRDNPFLSRHLSRHLDDYTIEQKRKLILIALLSHNESLAQLLAGGSENLQGFLGVARNLKVPDTGGEITTAEQLDILWSEFFATGRYAPVRKIVGALGLSRYRGTIERLKTGDRKEKTKEQEQEAVFEATYGVTVWSLINNCKRMPLVFNYCVYMYENEPLSEDIKNQLSAVLAVAQKKRGKEGMQGKDL